MEIVRFLDKPAAIVGTTGAGKTFAAKGAVEQLLALNRRVVVIDPTGAWYGLRSGAEGDEAGGFPVMIFGGDHADVPIGDEGGKALALAIAERHVQCVIDLSGMTNGEKIRFMTPFLENLYARNRTALHLVVDEADEIAAQKLADGEQRMFGAFDKIVRRGRIKGFRPLMITQRPAVIHKNVLSQIGTLIAMKLTSPQDRKAIEDWVKGNADADQAKAVMSSLPKLARGEGWIWSPADDVLDRTTFPSIRTFDSSRTPEVGEAVIAPAMTPVDVEALRMAMDAAKAKVEDVAKPASRAEIDQAERRGYERGLADGEARGKASGIAIGITRARTAIDALCTDDIADTIPIDPAPSNGRTSALGTKAREERPLVAATHAPLVESEQAPTASTLPPAKRRILSALRDLEAIGQTEPEKQVVAWFAEASPKSSAFANNLGAMRSAGLIDYPGQGLVGLTDAGRGAEPPRAAPTHEHIMALVAGKLTPALQRMLSAAVDVYPDTLDTVALAVAAGASPSSSAFANNRGRLRSLGLIDYPSNGVVRAADLLFPGGRS